MEYLKPVYHLRPRANWINDPNAPVYWQGQYHMFFQHNPDAAVWGNIHWGHAVSSDLVRWTLLPNAISPGPGDYDKIGIYSGGAIVKDNRLFLFYTAAEPQTQCLAVSEPDGSFKKHSNNPLIPSPPPGYDTPDFRDPFLWKDGNTYYMILASGVEGRGIVFLYSSSDLLKWKYDGELYSENLPEDIPAFECPLYFRLQDKDFLIFSPFDVSRYLCGEIKEGKFEVQTEGILDANSGWYAANTLETADGRRVLIAWLREERDVESQKRDGWSGCLSLPRECTVADDGSLLVKPLKELGGLRKTSVPVPKTSLSNVRSNLGIIPAAAELELFLKIEPGNGFDIRLFEDETGETYYSIRYQPHRIRLEDHLDSSDGEVCVKEIHYMPETDNMRLRIFLDNSVIEVFIDDKIALSSRLYPKNHNYMTGSARTIGDKRCEIEGTVYALDNSALKF